jgi:hypothetical protein
MTADVEGIRNKAIVTKLSYYAGICPERLGKTAKIRDDIDDLDERRAARIQL